MATWRTMLIIDITLMLPPQQNIQTQQNQFISTHKTANSQHTANNNKHTLTNINSKYHHTENNSS